MLFLFSLSLNFVWWAVFSKVMDSFAVTKLLWPFLKFRTFFAINLLRIWEVPGLQLTIFCFFWKSNGRWFDGWAVRWRKEGKLLQQPREKHVSRDIFSLFFWNETWPMTLKQFKILSWMTIWKSLLEISSNWTVKSTKNTLSNSISTYLQLSFKLKFTVTRSKRLIYSRGLSLRRQEKFKGEKERFFKQFQRKSRKCMTIFSWESKTINQIVFTWHF